MCYQEPNYYKTNLTEIPKMNTALALALALFRPQTHEKNKSPEKEKKIILIRKAAKYQITITKSTSTTQHRLRN